VPPLLPVTTSSYVTPPNPRPSRRSSPYILSRLVIIESIRAHSPPSCHKVVLISLPPPWIRPFPRSGPFIADPRGYWPFNPFPSLFPVYNGYASRLFLPRSYCSVHNEPLSILTFHLNRGDSCHSAASPTIVSFPPLSTSILPAAFHDPFRPV